MTASTTPVIAARSPGHETGVPSAETTETADARVAVAAGGARCGIDSVEIARIERLLAATPAGELGRIFSSRELADSGDGPGRLASLAARFAAKEACAKLFPRELAAGRIEPADFAVERDGYGAPK
ncbi:MAG TPA: 4'-phosphopantetheinyl transferase superfamily protein, partial [Casimicrobiaceae bacterium]|nr:4'-phosphopantetheinyl transferase superfamily protein [Casimicrobiaceae bacterium]